MEPMTSTTAPVQQNYTPAELPARIAALEGEVGALRAIRDAARAYVRAMEYADALTRTRFSDDEVRAAWAAASDAYDALVRALEREEAR